MGLNLFEGELKEFDPKDWGPLKRRWLSDCSCMTLKCEFRESATEEPPENQEPSPNGQGSHENRRLKNDEDEDDDEDGRLPAAPDRLLEGHHDHDLPPGDDDPLFCELVYWEPMAGLLSLDEEPTTGPFSVDEGTKRPSLVGIGGPMGALFSDDG